MNTQILATGIVKTLDHEYALAGVTVLALLPAGFPNIPGAALSEPLEIGHTQTKSDGSFELSIDADSKGAPYLCYLEHCAAPALQLRLEDANGVLMAETPALPFDHLQDILIPLHQNDWVPGPDDWKQLAGLIEDSKIFTLGILSTELASLEPLGVFADFSVQQRVGLLEALENALLDPDGTLAHAGVQLRVAQLQDVETRSALREQIVEQDLQVEVQAFDNAVLLNDMAGGHLQVADVLLDIKGFELGDVRGGVGRYFGNIGKNQQTGFDFSDLYPWLRSPLTGYRDYLVDIWVQRATRQLQGQALNAAGAVQQLNNRFHQDFSTLDESDQTANGMLHTILVNMLQAPTGMGFGFGISPATIEAQDERSDREYLNYLVSLTGTDVHELENRYRLNLQRSDLEVSNATQQNIATLQRFFTDSFQSQHDPHAIMPVLTANGLPIINEFTYPTQAHGPFFWQFEEWLERNDPFYAENFYDIRTTFSVGITDTESKTAIWGRTRTLAQFLDLRLDSNELRLLTPPINATPTTLTQELKIGDQWARNLVELQDLINDAHKDFFAGFYSSAESKYVALLKTTHHLQVLINRWKGTAWDKYNPAAFAAEQRAMAINNPDNLESFEKKYHTIVGYFLSGNTGQSWLGDTNKARVPYLINMLLNRLLPACLAEARLAFGKYREVIQGGTKPFAFDNSGFAIMETSLSQLAQFGVFTGPSPTEPGAKSSPPDTVWWPAFNANTGSLPYATNTTAESQNSTKTSITLFPANKIEKAWFRLKLGEAMLEWADQLYRTDRSEHINRARELYKGVLFLHGEDPEIEPTWGVVDWWTTKPFGIGKFTRNPRLTGQINRAHIGFEQINTGLNYYGYPKHPVPPVRYRVLREAALSFAASAKSAQNDYLGYMAKYEQAVIDEITVNTLLEKATYAMQIADEQVQIAQFTVGEAKKQVEGVKAQIAAKRKEIKDSESFFSQLGDFFSGMKDAASNLGKSALGSMSEESGDVAGGSVDYAALYKVISTKGGTTAAAAGLTGTMALTAGYGAFVYAGVTSMQSLEAAGNKRAGELKALQEGVLPAAEKMVELKQREVKIAGLHKAIAQADYNFGRKMLAFYDHRFLSKAFWQQMSGFANRLMRRYTDLGGRTAWFAERALSFETDQNIRLVSFDYFPKQLRGVTGADTLQLHLAEMEAARIHGLSQTIPVKQTFSMVRNFPIAFGQLKKLGQCQFSTSEAQLLISYPGVFGYRLRCVSIGATYADDAMPHKGMLSNHGFSMVSRRNGSTHRLLRYPDALPLSEFNMRGDMLVYDLPDETLLPFEGSGIETQWGLSLSQFDGVRSLESLTDVLLTFDMRASYSATLEAVHRAAQPTSLKKSLLISGRSQTPDEVRRFKKDQDILTLTFNPAVAANNSIEEMRTITLVALMLSGVEHDKIAASITAQSDAVTVAFDFDKGVALTNSGFLSAANAGIPLALNGVVGLSADQLFTVIIDTADNPGVVFSGLYDVQMVLEYEAQV